MTEGCSEEHARIYALMQEQESAVRELVKHVNALAPIVSGYKEQSVLVREIRTDLAAIDARQQALIAQITALSTQAMSNAQRAVEQARPAAYIQIGGFVLAVTLLILNLLGLVPMYENGKIKVVPRQDPQPAPKADRGRRLGE